MCRLLLAAALLAAGCSGASGPPPPPPDLPAGAIAGLQSRERALPASTLAAEALDHRGLARLLDENDYTAGTEREFFGRSRVFTHVVAQVLRFGDPRGADAFLRWARAHAVDTIGALRSTRPIRVGIAGVVVRPKGCGCHGEQPTSLAIWRHGSLAIRLLAVGPRADDARVAALARRLDEAVGG